MKRGQAVVKIMLAIAILALTLCLAGLLNAQEQKVNLPTNNIQADVASEKIGNSPEEIRDREALAWLIGECMRRLPECKEQAADMRYVFSQNIAVGWPKELRRIWIREAEEQAWSKLLDSQGVPPAEPPVVNGKIRRSAIDINVFMSDSKEPFLMVEVAKINESLAIQLVFSRGFYCQPLTESRYVEEMRGKCFLDHWRNPQLKTELSESELIYRLIVMAKSFQRLSFLRTSGNLEKVSHCRYGVVAETEIKSCAELLWQYEFKTLQALVKASIAMGGKNALGKPKYLPQNLGPFFREENGDKAVRNYLRYKMKYLYDRDMSPDYNPPLGEQIEAVRTEINALVNADQTIKLAELQNRLTVLTQTQTQFDKYAVYWKKHK